MIAIILSLLLQPSPKAMVVSAHPLASEAGISILKNGGNATDASIATQLALAVVFPAAGNIGGGGFMLMRSADGKYEALDYRETAPLAASAAMYLDKNGQVNSALCREGHLASGVPGTAAGLAAAHKKHGKLDWKTLVQPSINLARQGFPLTEKEADALNKVQEKMKRCNTISPAHLTKHWKKGDMIYHHDLANTLERIRDRGAAGFYEGKTAELIVKEMKRGKGIISAKDLAIYKPVWRTPISCLYRNYKITAMPPPSSGGIALFQMLKASEPFPVSAWGKYSVQTVHLNIEAERRAFADRAFYLGDPDFVKVPVKALTDSVYIASRMASFNPSRATPSREIKEGIVKYESEQTTHLSVVDAEGNAVSCTTTLNGWYGSAVVVGGAGFFLNNEMDDFSAKPGTPNMFGAIGGEANKIMPQKRMLSSMTPIIVEKNKELFLVAGTPGGTTIITTMFQIIQNAIDFHLPIQSSVEAKRYHMQWTPDTVFTEPHAFSKADSLTLTSMGHRLKVRGSIGRTDAILKKSDGLEGGADPRGDDAVRGF